MANVSNYSPAVQALFDTHGNDISKRDNDIQLDSAKKDAPFVRDVGRALEAASPEEFEAIAKAMTNRAKAEYLYNKYPGLFTEYDDGSGYGSFPEELALAFGWDTRDLDGRVDSGEGPSRFIFDARRSMEPGDFKLLATTEIVTGSARAKLRAAANAIKPAAAEPMKAAFEK